MTEEEREALNKILYLSRGTVSRKKFVNESNSDGIRLEYSSAHREEWNAAFLSLMSYMKRHDYFVGHARVDNLIVNPCGYPRPSSKRLLRAFYYEHANPPRVEFEYYEGGTRAVTVRTDSMNAEELEGLKKLLHAYRGTISKKKFES